MTVKNEKRKRTVVRRRRSRKLAVAIIGAGRLGIALGLALRGAGHTVNIAVTRTGRSANRAAALLQTRVPAIGSKPLRQMRSSDRVLIAQSDVLLISTRDDSIHKVASELAAMFDLPAPVTSRPARPIALHTSGALTSEALNALQEVGFATGSMHPLMSISGQINESQPFSGIHFSFEGDMEAVRLGKQLARDFGGESFVIDQKSKPLYHAAAVTASPNVTALIDIAIEMLSHCGIGSSAARKMLLPLIQSTVENLISQSPRQALTGTFKRGDIETVKLHLASIASERLTDALAAYAMLGQRSLTMSGVPKSKQRTIEKLMAEVSVCSEPTGSAPTKRKSLASKSPRRN